MSTAHEKHQHEYLARARECTELAKTARSMNAEPMMLTNARRAARTRKLRPRERTPDINPPVPVSRYLCLCEGAFAR